MMIKMRVLLDIWFEAIEKKRRLMEFIYDCLEPFPTLTSNLQSTLCSYADFNSYNESFY